MKYSGQKCWREGRWNERKAVGLMKGWVIGLSREGYIRVKAKLGYMWIGGRGAAPLAVLVSAAIIDKRLV